ncbi:MAG: serpin family protein [Verrucomicrobia bacterium]|nr:serpin family protein [Verrucomicrobiota bacterium]
MNRINFIAALLILGGAGLRAQAPTGPATLTVINDAAWRNPAAAIDASRARLPSQSARLANVSVRARAGSGGDTLIAGAVVQGPGTLPMLVRAIGPGLRRFGVADTLRDPKLEIFHGSVLAAQTNTAGAPETAASAYVGAFPPVESTGGVAAGDAALMGQPAAGTITAHCSPAAGASGVALVEFYDGTAAPSTASARFLNFSARARVESGEGLVVVGFVVAGEGYATLLMRAAGPTLGQFDVSDFLPDPRIELYSGNILISANDNWRDGDPHSVKKVQDAGSAVGAFALSSASDAALMAMLPAGAYTLQVRGAGAQSGVALAEVFQVATEEFDAARATNGAGLDLYRELAKTRPGQNLVISPYSIESALALAYAGADGSTRSEMARALFLPGGNGPLQADFTRLRTELNATAEASKATAEARTRSGARTDPIEWNQANRLFGQQGYAFRDPFLTLMRDGFAAPFQAMDFRANPEPPRLAINAWVEDQTRQKIKDLIPAGGLTDATRLVLVNALFLKAPWDSPFAKSLTAPRTFRPATGSNREVPTMQRTALLGYAVEDGLTIVTLDYLGAGLQFVILLPDQNQDLDTAAARLTPAHFARWANLRQTSRRDVALYLPKFTVPGATVPLGPVLRAIGVKSAFDEPRGSANFDPIAPRRPDDYLYISDVFHQTFVALDEEGTEAAAATAVVPVTAIDPSPRPQPIEVRVDRPFLFAIQHRSSGVCLFLGRIADPR